MKTVSVVVPVYFNEESLPLLFAALLNVEAQLGERACALELIFVDDGSGDQSLKRLLQFRQDRPGTKVIKLTRNFGAVHASKAGLHFVTGDCFCWLSADLQDPPQLVVEMVNAWLSGAKYVIAARSARRDPAATRMFASLYYRLVRWFVLKDYPRAGFDLALIDKSLLPYLRDSSRTVNTELLSYWLGVAPVRIDYQRQERLHGKSGWTFAKKLSYLIDSMLGFSVWPVRLLTVIGLLAALISLGYGIWLIARGQFGFAALISFLLGLILLMLGLIGEYVWRIFDELSRRPEVVIDEFYP